MCGLDKRLMGESYLSEMDELFHKSAIWTFWPTPHFDLHPCSCTWIKITTVSVYMAYFAIHPMGDLRPQTYMNDSMVVTQTRPNKSSCQTWGGVSVDAQRLNIGVVGGENLDTQRSALIESWCCFVVFRMNCWLRSDVLRPQPCRSRPRVTKWQFTMVILLGLYRPSGWVKVTVHFMIMIFGCFWGERPALWFEFL